MNETLKQLDELDSAEKAATPGRWTAHHSMEVYGSYIEDENGGHLMRTTSYGHRKDDANLVAISRNKIRALIDIAIAAEFYLNGPTANSPQTIDEILSARRRLLREALAKLGAE